MNVQKPSIPKGTRDFSPVEMNRRTFIFDTVKDVFRTYGYSPLETPAMENLSTLLGKYGEEGDKLLFKVLNSGDFTSAITPDVADNPPLLSTRICEKGLRYDLTVPFARYVVQHQNEITFPFKRYQVQPVWRADRPQKGRYREFYQCDVDVVGSRSLYYEYELIRIVEEVFDRLGVRVVMKVNNRKILFGIAETIGHSDKMVDITVAIDKLDKIGLANVEAELEERGLGRRAIEQLEPILALTGSNQEKLNTMRLLLCDSPTGLAGVEELESVFVMLRGSGSKLDVELDLSLARGLNYYTGAIFEVKAADWPIGSICGGGRYDDLTGIFGLPDTSGVGISFGADRIYDVMCGLDLFPRSASVTTKVMMINFGGDELSASLTLLDRLRKAGIASDIYPEAAKMKKQLEYADRRAIPFVVIVGQSEMEQQRATVKDMTRKEQTQVDFDQLTDYFKNQQ